MAKTPRNLPPGKPVAREAVPAIRRDAEHAADEWFARAARAQPLSPRVLAFSEAVQRAFAREHARSVLAPSAVVATSEAPSRVARAAVHDRVLDLVDRLRSLAESLADERIPFTAERIVEIDAKVGRAWGALTERREERTLALACLVQVLDGRANADSARVQFGRTMGRTRLAGRERWLAKFAAEFGADPDIAKAEPEREAFHVLARAWQSKHRMHDALGRFLTAAGFVDSANRDIGREIRTARQAIRGRAKGAPRPAG